MNIIHYTKRFPWTCAWIALALIALLANALILAPVLAFFGMKAWAEK